MHDVYIGKRLIGCGNSPFVIAEAGVNHNGDLQMAFDLIDAAVDCGADCIKFQLFSTDSLVTKDAPKAAYQNRNVGEDVSQFDMLKGLELSQKDIQQLMSHSGEKGIEFLCSPFDQESLSFLLGLDVQAVKIPSGELTNLPLLEQAGASHVPVILSTGMATLEEIDEAVETIRFSGNTDLILLHCLSCYPADPAETNLSAIRSMRNRYAVPVGYSDHTEGIEIAVAATALSSCVLEKHITLDRQLSGPDHSASLEPQQFKEMVDGIRAAFLAIGDGFKRPMPSEIPTIEAARKSLVSKVDMVAGETVKPNSIAIKRPGTGMPPNKFQSVIGRRMKRSIPMGHVFQEDDFAPEC